MRLWQLVAIVVLVVIPSGFLTALAVYGIVVITKLFFSQWRG